jgi:hypothetical protein
MYHVEVISIQNYRDNYMSFSTTLRKKEKNCSQTVIIAQAYKKSRCWSSFKFPYENDERVTLNNVFSSNL